MPLALDGTEVTDEELGPYEKKEIVPVIGRKLYCANHPEDKKAKFVFDYSDMRFKHQHKNGGLCSGEVRRKN